MKRSNLEIPHQVDSAISSTFLLLYAEFFAYTTPPQRTWQGLTNDEIKEYLLKPVERDLLSFTRFIETKLKQKNGFAEENT